MKIFKKERLSNGRRHIYFCGVKIISYKKHIDTKPKRKIIGTDNIVNINEDCHITVTVYGNNNTVIVDDHKYLDIFNIQIGTADCPCDNCTIKIGKGFSSNGSNMLVLEDDTTIEIGNDCMFSENIILWPSDTHTITDVNGNITNVGKYITIGNHVWVGYGATILKNTIIPDNCVIGTGSVVSGTFKKTNCVIAGNPAKVVKENINWDRRRPKQYLSKDL